MTLHSASHRISRSISDRRGLPALKVAVLAVLLGSAVGAAAQIPLQPDETAPAAGVTLPSFDVVSIKENRSDAHMMRIMMTRNGLETTGLPVKDLLSQAYGIRQDLIFGLPEWAGTVRFDVNAKVADEDVATLKKLTPRQRGGMLLPVLAERFQLQAHKEVRNLPTYDLVADKGGPRLKTSTALPPPPPGEHNGPPDMRRQGMFTIGPDRFSATGVQVRMLVNQLAYILNRTVVDKTGLAGRYDIELKWTPEETAAAGSDNGAEDQAGSIFTALHEQLGLKLVSSKGPVDTLVVDRIEKLTEN